MSGKILIMSDIHLCHAAWDGVEAADRVEQMICELNAAYQKEPYDAIFFLGDYSLDHWVCDIGGSWLHHGISNTQKLKDAYLSRLDCSSYYMIPGNHEQYGHEKWRSITGCNRQFSVMHQGYLVVMLDTFGADLDPEADSDGTYTPVDVDYVRSQMAAFPDAPVLLCSHYFDLQKESEAFMDFVKNEDRIMCLFCGHDHQNRIEAPARLGGKLIIHDGHFSYSGSGSHVRCPWGWLEVQLREDGINCCYVNPACMLNINENSVAIPAGEGPMIQITKDSRH